MILTNKIDFTNAVGGGFERSFYWTKGLKPN